MLNLAMLLEGTRRTIPDDTAILFQDQEYSYRELDDFANQVANGLKSKGIGKGDKVALSCPNVPYFPVIYFGILKTGAAVVPLNVLLKAEEVAYHLQDSGAKAYFCFAGSAQLPMGEAGWRGFKATPECEFFWLIEGQGTLPVLEAPATLAGLVEDQSIRFCCANTSSEDTAVILYTSGTTGRPKGAELTHSNMLMNAKLAINFLQFSQDDVAVVVLPLFHSFGQSCLMNAGLLAGATLVLMPRFDPELAVKSFEQQGVTVFAGVPTMYWALLKYAEQRELESTPIGHCLRICISGGSAMPVETLKRFEEKFHAPVMEGYGLSETSPVATFNPLFGIRKVGSIGVPIWGVEVDIVDDQGRPLPPETVGEVVIRGHNVMKGYLNRPEETAKAIDEAGWFHTGDLGKMDYEGYFFIVDRKKDMIIRGGYNIYPRELEELLLTHPAVSLAAVVGIPDEQYGEEVKAVVVLREGVHITANEILEWAKERLAAYKYPRVVEIVDSVPMTATGKILKRELTRQHAQAI